MKRKRPGHRYEICKDCGREWNISLKATVYPGGYLCPKCTAKYWKVRY